MVYLLLFIVAWLALAALLHGVGHALHNREVVLLDELLAHIPSKAVRGEVLYSAWLGDRFNDEELGMLATKFGVAGLSSPLPNPS